jgi:hypothetical protein
MRTVLSCTPCQNVQRETQLREIETTFRKSIRISPQEEDAKRKALEKFEALLGQRETVHEKAGRCQADKIIL